MEVANKAEDGTTDIITKIYESSDVFNENHLDLSIKFAYTKEKGEWSMIKYEDFEKLMSEKKELLIYYIDFNGMSDEAVDRGEVISYSIVYQ